MPQWHLGGAAEFSWKDNGRADLQYFFLWRDMQMLALTMQHQVNLKEIVEGGSLTNTWKIGIINLIM